MVFLCFCIGHIFTEYHLLSVRNKDARSSYTVRPWLWLSLVWIWVAPFVNNHWHCNICSERQYLWRSFTIRYNEWVLKLGPTFAFSFPSKPLQSWKEISHKPMQRGFSRVRTHPSQLTLLKEPLGGLGGAEQKDLSAYRRKRVLFTVLVSN